MIIILTATPGSGKTLYTVTQLAKEWAKDNRPVYYTGIPELKLPWIEVKDPQKWAEEVGQNGVYVIDEAQDHFPPCQPGKEPEFIKQLSKHRHLSIDIVFITQHPSFLNTYVRKNCGKHIHLYRPFGWTSVSVWTWNKYDDSYDSEARKKLAISSRWHYDKSGYGLYKSADVHTHKRTFPKKFLLVPLAFGVIVYGGVNMYNFVNRIGAPPGAAGSPQAVAARGGAEATSTPGKPRSEMFDGKRDPMRADGVQGVQGVNVSAQSLKAGFRQPWEEERYAEITKPKRAPVPVACVKRRIDVAESCVCYTEDATVIDTKGDFCSDYVNGRIFADWKESPYEAEKQRKAGEGTNAPVKYAEALQPPKTPDYVPIAIPAGAPVTAHRSASYTVAPTRTR